MTGSSVRTPLVLTSLATGGTIREISAWVPEEQRPESDIEDMYELLNEKFPNVLGAMVAREDDRPLPEPVVKLVPKAPEEDAS